MINHCSCTIFHSCTISQDMIIHLILFTHHFFCYATFLMLDPTNRVKNPPRNPRLQDDWFVCLSVCLSVSPSLGSRQYNYREQTTTLAGSVVFQLVFRQFQQTLLKLPPQWFYYMLNIIIQESVEDVLKQTGSCTMNVGMQRRQQAMWEHRTV